MKILIIGNGYIGGRCKDVWANKAILSEARIQKAEDVLELLEKYQPDAVLNAAGKKGQPNVDWCETHQMETIEGNVKLPIMIAQACQQKGIYLLHIGSGCIFYGESPDPKGWKEDDFGNPLAVYSRCKWAADLALSTLDNTGIARIRMPIDYVPSAGNLINKLAQYPKIIDVENSVTILSDMIDVFYQLLEKKAQGIFHVTNPGILKHREIIALYKKFVDPSIEKEWINEEDLVKQGLVSKKRSNNILQSANLAKLGINMREVHQALEDTMKKYALEKNKKFSDNDQTKI